MHKETHDCWMKQTMGDDEHFTLLPSISSLNFNVICISNKLLCIEDDKIMWVPRSQWPLYSEIWH